MAEEVDIIQHLINIEKDAAQMLSDAKVQADKKIAEARFEAENSFKEKYAEVSKRLSAEEESEKKECDTSHAEVVRQYKDKLSSTAKDVKAFNSLLDELLFA